MIKNIKKIIYIYILRFPWITLHFLLFICLFFIDFKLEYLLMSLIGWILIGGFGVELGLHRYYSHRMFKLNKFWEVIVTFLGTMSFQGTPHFWAAVHRASHHPNADKENDPHSPKNGIFHSYFGWQYNFNYNIFKSKFRYIKDVMRNDTAKFFNKYYYYINFSVLSLFLFININIGFYLLLFPIVFSWHMVNMTNVLGHCESIGYKKLQTKDDSINNRFLSFLTWGQMLHNNHHAKPMSSNFAKNKYEIDTCYPLILLISSKERKK